MHVGHNAVSDSVIIFMRQLSASKTDCMRKNSFLISVGSDTHLTENLAGKEFKYVVVRVQGVSNVFCVRFLALEENSVFEGQQGSERKLFSQPDSTSQSVSLITG